MVQVMATTLNALKVYYDPEGNTLTVWFDDPQKEASSEETGSGVVLNKDKQGRVIGFEKLYVELKDIAQARSFPVELMVRQ